MWQLKTIQDENKNIQKVDTIFYSFQRQAIFSYTILTGTSSDLPVIYGYVDFPAKDKLHIQLDRMYEQTSEPDRMLWKGMQTEYDILKLTSKEMILEQEGKLFNFIKF
jgi:hypothetical protein